MNKKPLLIAIITVVVVAGGAMGVVSYQSSRQVKIKNINSISDLKTSEKDAQKNLEEAKAIKIY